MTTSTNSLVGFTFQRCSNHGGDGRHAKVLYFTNAEISRSEHLIECELCGRYLQDAMSEEGDLLSFSVSDLSAETLRRSHEGTSYSPERRAAMYAAEYLSDMFAVMEEFSPFATPENREALAADLAAYRVGYVSKMQAYLSAHGRVLSTMITGGSGWTAANVRANSKRSDSADRRSAEWHEWHAKTIKRLRLTWNPRIAAAAAAAAPIKTGDEDALERLQKKLDQCQRLQESMKAANKIIRCKGTDEEKVQKMVALGLTESNARKALQPDFASRKGFPSYALTNNSAEIRRIKARIAEVESERERAAKVEEAGADEVRYEALGLTYCENTDEDRVQLVFDGKPDSATRDTLKRRGFRWAPSQGAWQRQNTPNGRNAAREVIAALTSQQPA
jgi:hypothetical protein